MKLYPPGGKGVPITPHPAKIDEMKEKGWVEKPVKTKPTTKDKEV